jgi:hypothetical protein
MKQVLGSILAALIVFNGGLAALPIDDAYKVTLGLFTASFIAALSFYLGPVIGDALKSFSKAAPDK